MLSSLPTTLVSASYLKLGKVELLSENYSYPETLIGGIILLRYTKSGGNTAYL